MHTERITLESEVNSFDSLLFKFNSLSSNPLYKKTCLLVSFFPIRTKIQMVRVEAEQTGPEQVSHMTGQWRFLGNIGQDIRAVPYIGSVLGRFHSTNKCTLPRHALLLISTESCTTKHKQTRKYHNNENTQKHICQNRNIQIFGWSVLFGTWENPERYNGQMELSVSNSINSHLG